MISYHYEFLSFYPSTGMGSNGDVLIENMVHGGNGCPVTIGSLYSSG